MRSIKYLVVVLAILFMSGFVYAEQTGTSWWHSHSYTDKDSWRDEYNEYQVKNNWYELGLGVDVIVYEFEGMTNDIGLDSIEIQQRWNQTDNRYASYAVVKCNAYKAIKNLLGK